MNQEQQADRLGLVLAGIAAAVGVAVVAVLLLKTHQSGAGLDAGWGAFLVFLFGFAAKLLHKDRENDTHTQSEAPAAG